MRSRSWVLVIAMALALVAPRSAEAFCGFYVGQAGEKLTNDATMVVLLRDGTRTVLSMQNDYQGPPDDFALVIPVPVVLQKENVKTLENKIFSRVDAMTSPRLVEYWEQDPCPAESEDDFEGGTGTRAKSEEGSMGQARFGVAAQVRVEAKFAVAEYEIVILSADDALALDRWLRDNHYNLPENAESALRPYVAAGSKFFVARVDAKKVRFENGRARLSPLRFHYDAETFSLPIRLGLLNAAGHQDLVVNVIAKQRYDVANYPHATLPTNLEVEDSAKRVFPELYAAIFDETLEKHPGAIVTEYAWSAGSCDPCPGPLLSPEEIAILGADTLPQGARAADWVVTRLHARYAKEQLKDDLVFAEAPPIQGGREGQGTEPLPSGSNNFQTRVIIRHPWMGPIACSNPMRGWWGPPPSNRTPLPEKRDPTIERGKIRLASLMRTSPVPSVDEPPPWKHQQVGYGALLGLALAAVIAGVSESRARRRR